MTPMTFPSVPDPMPAVEKVWSDNAEVVRRFKLSASPGNVVKAPNDAVRDSWYVMVFCGVPDADAYELAKALRALQREVEKESGLDVTLMLSNAPDKPLNGTTN